MQTRDNPFNKIYTLNPEKVPWGYKHTDLDFICIVERLHFMSNAKILDMGCGNGKNAIYLEARKFKVWGFDISEKAVSVAKRRVSSGNFIVADVAQLPYKRKYFDIIIDWGLFHCIPVRKRSCVKKEILRILKPGGYYIMRTFFCPKGHPARTPLFYESLDQTGRTKERDVSRQQFPVWGLNFCQIANIFSCGFMIKNKFYSGNRIITVISKNNSNF